ncbi:hypothetical protein ABZX75_24870 [Streptomyces sp. NPDC003038]|uniref:hypothetical protein n=1 Tax=unclassified Streptomyces TaxID=2593676 RepID=UPI0033B5A8A0
MADHLCDEAFQPTDQVIECEISRNRDALPQLIENADCRYRSIGKQASKQASK